MLTLPNPEIALSCHEDGTGLTIKGRKVEGVGSNAGAAWVRLG